MTPQPPRSPRKARLPLVFRVLLAVAGLGIGVSAAAQTTDYDDDNDNLIDIRNLAQLNAVRWDLDGNGQVAAGDATNYATAFPNPATGMGCQSTCVGYELRTDLNFDTDGDNDVDASDPNSYPNWNPIGGDYSGTFEGNGHTISNLTMNRSDSAGGLFHGISGVVRNLGLMDVNLTHSGDHSSLRVASLAFRLEGSNGAVIGVGATGSVTATGRFSAAGLVGDIRYGARLAASFFRGTVTGPGNINGRAGGWFTRFFAMAA